MAYGLQHQRERLPRIAASAIAAGVPVHTSASQTDRVLACGSAGVRVLGFSMATAASPGDGVTVQTEGIVLARAVASIGPGALVSVATTTGRLGVAPSGAQIAGESVNAAADGDYFSVRLKPAGPVA